MNPAYIVVPIYYIRLRSVSKFLHQFLGKGYDLVLRHIVCLCRIDGSVERHLFAAPAAALIHREGIHRLFRVGNARREDRFGLTLSDLLLVVLHG